MRDPILAALNLLLADQHIADDKALAAKRRMGVTAASINGARNLLAKSEPAAPGVAPVTVAERPSPSSRTRTVPAVDTKALIKQVVG